MRFLPAALIFLSSSFAMADVPRVAVDILPVHSLVAQVMQGAGTPDLIMTPGASPHGYAMRPSQAAALAEADLVIWIGEGLTPWLHKPIRNLAVQADVLELMEVEGTVVLPFREGALFEDSGHDHIHGDEHESIDPHAWLDPINAGLWMAEIARRLAVQDPENAELYQRNAVAGQAEMTVLLNVIDTLMDPLRGTRFMVYHDAYHYFESRFEVEAAGALSPGDATAPSPARLDHIRTSVRALQIACVFSEPQFNASLVDAITDGTNTRVKVLDPMGANLVPGESLYRTLLLQMAITMSGCVE